jgi:hypothetical protein
MTDSSAAILSQKKNTFFFIFVFFWQLSFFSFLFFFFFWLVEFVIIFIGPFLGGDCVTGTSATLPKYLLYRSSSISQYAPLFSLSLRHCPAAGHATYTRADFVAEKRPDLQLSYENGR